MVSGIRLLSATAGGRGLPAGELETRARRVRLVLADCDGVLTDSSVYYSDRGEEMKRFSMRDGMGVERLRLAGIETGIVTRERSGAVARRAEKLGLRLLFEGVFDKEKELPDLLSAGGCDVSEVAYIGDDVNDLGILRAVGERGLTGAPFDAVEEVSGAVHRRCSSRGGEGAFREFAEWLLRLRSGSTARSGEEKP